MMCTFSLLKLNQLIMKIYNLGFLPLFLCFVAASQSDSVYHGPSQFDSVQSMKMTGPVTKIVLKSTDGGNNWQDLSQGLPDNWMADDLFANQNGLFVSAGNQIYHNNPNSSIALWDKETCPDDHRNIAAGKAGIYAFNWNGQFLQKRNGTTEWSPLFKEFRHKG